MRNDDRRGWSLVAIFLLIGLLCIIVAGNLAIRLAPRWTLQADMRSRLNPDVDYYTSQPGYILPPLDPAILTPPIWINIFLTPGQAIPTRVWLATATPPETARPTQVPPTDILTFTPTPTNTLAFFIPTKLSTPNATPTKTAAAGPTATLIPSLTSVVIPSIIPPREADLQIAIDDHATAFEPGTSVQYVIVVSNPAGSAAAPGATVSSSLSANLVNISWSCSGAAGASCTGSGTGNIVDAANLPSGSSVTYQVSAQVVGSPTSSLESSVTVNPPPGITDPYPANNQAADIDQLVVASTLPHGNIDPVKNDTIEYVPTNTTLTLQLDSPLNVGSHPGYDLIYYELPQGENPGIWMDAVILQLGDGRNWYTILNWGNNMVDTNASMNMSTIGASSEIDNQVVDASFMYELTGVALELDGVVPAGTYKYFRIIAPAAPQDGPAPDAPDGVEIDAIYIVP